MDGETSAGEERERQGHLCDDEGAAEAVTPSTNRGPAFFLQRVVEIQASGLPGGDASRNNARQDGRAEGEQENGDVETDVCL